MRHTVPNVLRYIVYCSILVCSGSVFSETAGLPQYDSNLHLGVTTCSGSTCHGALEPFDDSSVEQNEFITWERLDSHSKAYQVLLNNDSKRIARNLGLKSAHTTEICLDCHADNLAEEKRGKRFHLEDGVGCEACHGGAETYLGLHTSGQATHAENIQNGMYPTEDPVKRATLCLSCHFGNNKKFVTHEIMGAGHPRMSFELDTFTAIMPAHYKVDADYKERKKYWNNAKVWAIGQTLIVQEYLKQLSRPDRLRAGGIFPELVFFDCHACHHSMDDKRWGARGFVPLKPGTVRLNDANFLILKEIAGIVDPGLGNTWKKQTIAFHSSTTRGLNKVMVAAQSLQQTNKKLIIKIADYPFSQKTAWSLVQRITNQGILGEYRDYIAAEQSLMAIDALLTSLENVGAIDISGTSKLGQQLDALYKVLEKADNYNYSHYIDGLKKLRVSLKQ